MSTHVKVIADLQFVEDLEDVCTAHSKIVSKDPRFGEREFKVLNCKEGRPLATFKEFFFQNLYRELLTELAFIDTDDAEEDDD